MYPVNERKIGDNSCPYCNHTKLKSGVNDLTITNPQLASEFSPRNDKKANEVGEWQKYEVFWICPTCKQEFRREVRKMAAGFDECPICTGRVAIEGYNSLADEHPDIPFIWSEKNDKKPTEVTSISSYDAIWYCPTCKQEFRREVRKVVDDEFECPICTGKTVVAGYNSLEDEYPEIAKRWAESNDRLPSEVLSSHIYRAEWVCPTCGGKYTASVRDVVNGLAECPYCNNEKPLAGFNTLKALYPEIAKEMNPNNEKGPDDVLPTSAYLAEWTCPTCGYTYKASVRDRVASDDLCPACAGKKAQAGFNSLLDIYPEVQDEWAENENTLLGIFPDEILPTSNARVWWECKDCGRKYLLSVNMWVEKHNRGMTSCTYCSGLRMRETHVLL